METVILDRPTDDDTAGSGVRRLASHQDDRPLTPAARRRPDALPGVGIVLLDGQEWEIPDVVLEFYEDPGRPDGVGIISNISPAFDRACLDYDDARSRVLDDPESADGHWIRDLLRLCGELVRRNYEVAPAEMRELVRFVSTAAGQGDSVTTRLRNHAVGISDRPKAGGPGSLLPSEPTG